MSIREKIHKKSLQAKRTLFDHSIKLRGKEVQAVKISIAEEDIYHDTTDTVIESSVITAVIAFPDRVPLDRFRYNGQPQVEETRTYFFEVLPIECYTKFSDHVETKDILVFALEDEGGNKIPFVLQVTDSFGKFEYGLVWKMQYLAQVNGAFPSDVRDYITDVFEGL